MLADRVRMGSRGRGKGDVKWVTVGGSGTSTGGLLAVSTDGVKWHMIEGIADVEIRDVAYGDGRWVAVNNANRGFMTSVDGWNWEVTKPVTASSRQLNGITYGDGKWVSVGHTGNIYVSTDAYNWTRYDSGVTNQLNSVAYSGSRWVAVGHSGVIRRSSDGMLWSSRSSNVTNSLWSVHWDGTYFIAVGGRGAVTTSTSAGSTWTVRSSGFGSTVSDRIMDSTGVYGSTKLAVGSNGEMCKSRSTLYYDDVVADTSFGGTSINGVAYGNEMWVAVGDEGKIGVSYDMDNWFQVDNPFNGVKINAVAYGGE